MIFHIEYANTESGEDFSLKTSAKNKINKAISLMKRHEIHNAAGYYGCVRINDFSGQFNNAIFMMSANISASRYKLLEGKSSIRMRCGNT